MNLNFFFILINIPDGYYDDHLNYIPGENWNDKKQCYESGTEEFQEIHDDLDDEEEYYDEGKK